MKTAEVEIKLRYLPVLVRATRIKRSVDEIVKNLQHNEAALAEVRAMKAKLNKKSFQLEGCTVSEGVTASEKDFRYPFWLEFLLKIAGKISNMAQRYRKAHPERGVVLKEGSPYVKVSVPKEIVKQTRFSQVATLIKQFEAMQN